MWAVMWREKRKRQAHKWAKNLENYRATHVRWSAFGQISTTSCHVMAMTSYFWHTKAYSYKRNRQDRSQRIFEPIIGCKHPIIASGATPIGSTGCAPDDKSNQKENGCMNQADKMENILRVALQG
jgi:hypothetical protein